MAETIIFKQKTYSYVKVVPYSPSGRAKPRVNIYVRGAPAGKSMVGSVEYTEDKNELGRRVTQKLAEKQPVVRQRLVPVREEPAKEIKKIYRSLITITDTDHGTAGGVEWRIWVHTSSPKITKSDLLAKADELHDISQWDGPVPIDTKKMEINEEYDEDMKAPRDARLDEWFGWIEVKRARFHFHSRGTGALEKSGSFEVAD